MGYLLRNWRISAATLFSVALVFGAYLLAKSVVTPSVVQASEETALLQAIATKDSTGDGLPDWEKSLYGIPLDATTTDYFHTGMTDGQAVAKGLIVPKAIADIPSIAPTSVASSSVDYAAFGLPTPTSGTITDSFTKTFFTLYLAAKQNNGGQELAPADVQSVADKALSSLAGSIAPAQDFKSLADLNVSGTGQDALRAFAIAAEAVLKRNATGATKSEIGYLQSAVEDGDTSAPGHLSSLAKAYRDSAVGIAGLPVPQELATDDLAIINAIMRLGEIDNDFSRVDIDPLATMYALQQYPQTELAGEHAFTTLANIYAAEGVALKNGTPGAAFVNLMTNIGAQQAANVNTP